MNDLFFLLAFIFLGTAFVIAGILTPFICAYNSDNVDKSTYECGVKLFGDVTLQYDVKFINFAVMFLIFDASLIFLFPFALVLTECSLSVLLIMIFFLLILLFVLIFAIYKRILRWQ